METQALEAVVDRVTAKVAAQFCSFGGGEGGDGWNPLSEWLKDSPPVFALGVEVRKVVIATLTAYERELRQAAELVASTKSR